MNSLLKNNILHFLNSKINSSAFQLALLKENTIQAAAKFALCCQKFKVLFSNELKCEKTIARNTLQRYDSPRLGVIIKNLKELFKYVKGMTSRADDEQLTDEDKFIEYFSLDIFCTITIAYAFHASQSASRTGTDTSAEKCGC